MLENLTIWGALFAGLLSFVSPCVLPLVPPYLGFLAGVSIDELTGSGDERVASRRVLLVAFCFVLGFSTVFVILGASASLIGKAVAQYLDVLAYLAGAAIIAMGLHFLGVLRLTFLYREARIHVERKPAGLLGAYVIGLAFAFGWTPCVGPILAAILFVAGSEDTVQQGALLLAAYAFGLGVPFLVAALFAGPFLAFMKKSRRYMHRVEQVMGVFLVLTGILFITGQMTAASYWLLETFPMFSTIG
ncbi:MAG: cytochrome c biogenesis protein CcdA [Rhodobacteraceae bacterium]|nr:cytochrome c biogenesis protein CcdA [Paracoccaceae bacterium]